MYPATISLVVHTEEACMWIKERLMSPEELEQHLERMRRPHPKQGEIDAAAARLLRNTALEAERQGQVRGRKRGVVRSLPPREA
jgi:hypothetical protein